MPVHTNSQDWDWKHTSILQQLVQEKGFSSHDSYSLSKLAMQLFTKELAGRLGNRSVTANCLDPGTVNTKMLYAGWGPCGIDLQVGHFSTFC